MLGWQRHAALVLDIHVMINWHVKTRNLLTSITWPYRGLKCTTHGGHVFFGSWPLTKYWFSIGSRAHVMLTCWKQGRIVRKPVNASAGLKFILFITFSSIHLLLCFEYMVITKLKTESQTVNRKRCRKVTKLKSTFYLFLGWLNRELDNLATELRF